MFFDHDRRPEDIPAPPTPDEVAVEFPVPLLTLAGQQAIEEPACSTMSSTSNGRTQMESATLSYTLWRNPRDRDDPVNLAELTPELRIALETEPPRQVPEWIGAWRDRMRFSLLWDAVRATHISDGSTWHTPELALVEHAEYILMNTFRETRMRGEWPGELVVAPTEADVEHDVPIVLDDAEVRGIRIEADPDVLALGADLGDRYVTAVFDRRDLPYLSLAFATRPAP